MFLVQIKTICKLVYNHLVFPKTIRLFCILLLIGSSLLFLIPIQVSADSDVDSPSDLYAKAAVLMDAESGRILYEKNGKLALPMASTTKIMTCIIALENSNLSDYAKVSPYAVKMPKVKLNVHAEEYYQLEDLLYSLMLESHNDSAVVIAEHIASSTSAFADMMNQKARDLGCFDTYFITPNGLDATATSDTGEVLTHSTTATDLARIMSYCIMYSPQKDAFLKITSTEAYSFSNYTLEGNQFNKGGRTFHCHNHNIFLSMMDGALSGKTGFTGNAGYCYVGSLRREQRTFVVALLACGWPNNKSYKWSDTKSLMKYGLANYEHHSLSEISPNPDYLVAIPVINGQPNILGEKAYTNIKLVCSSEDNNFAGMDNVSNQADVSGLLLKKGEEITIKYDIKKELTAPVHKGDSVGTVKYMVNDEIYRLQYVIADDSVDAINFKWCLMQILTRYLTAHSLPVLPEL